MPLLIQYFFKLFISLAFVYLFYQLVLRRLTFYNSNRWYLAGYTFLAFFISFIDISQVMKRDSLNSNNIVQLIPSVDTYTAKIEGVTRPAPFWSWHWDKWDWLMLVLFAGTFFLLVRFIVRFVSFYRLRRRATLVSAGGIKLFRVNESIIPFSFGNAVFFNPALHSTDELREIVEHEFVHVRQKHTIDIIWAEVLCILNWYNPFAWLLKTAIRQNLEFIADNKVLQNGVNKKQYQYLLLKVIGNNHFSIASQFNFSSLKKRIVMMNKIKSARIQALRLLFLLPVTVILLLSFRSKWNGHAGKQERIVRVNAEVMDSIPDPVAHNEKGYLIAIKGDKGNRTVVVSDRNGKEVESILLTKWQENAEYYENKYGKLPPPPPPPPAPAPPPPPPPPPVPTTSQWVISAHGEVSSISVSNNKAVVTLKNGKKEKYDLSNKADKERFTKKYGQVPPPPPPPPVNWEQPANSGQPVNAPSTTNPPQPVSLTADEITYTTHPADGPTLTAHNVIVAGAPARAEAPAPEPTVSAEAYPAGAEEEVLFVITSNTTPGEFDEFAARMKKLQIIVKYDELKYDGDRLKGINATIKSKDAQNNFSISRFNKIIISKVTDGKRILFKVAATNASVTI